MLSGAFCSGLIEALALIVKPLPRSRRYPGLFAPASLKQRRPSSVISVELRLSGAFCSGLIEALRHRLRAWSVDMVIRGFLLRPH